MTASRWPTSSPTTSKHNEANGEDNRDGHDDNLSWNCGVEGPTDDPAILDLRDRMRRNLDGDAAASQGTPMLLMGDEIGRTQHGNNNAYCQDNEISWMDWERRERTKTLPSRIHHAPDRVCAAAIRSCASSNSCTASATCDDGHGRYYLAAAGWRGDDARRLGQRADTLHRPAARRGAGSGMLLMLLNAHDEQLPFVLPNGATIVRWRLLVDTADAAS